MSKIGTTVARIVIFILGENALKQVLLVLLKRFAEKTDTEVDDRLVNVISMALNNKRDITDLRGVINEWETRLNESK